jgi:hypothetical protein
MTMPDGTPQPLTEPLVDTRTLQDPVEEIVQMRREAERAIGRMTERAVSAIESRVSIRGFLDKAAAERTRLERQVEGLTVLRNSALEDKKRLASELESARSRYNGVWLSLQTCERQLRDALDRADAAEGEYRRKSDDHDLLAKRLVEAERRPPWGDIPQERVAVLRAIADERKRQIEEKGYSLDHDNRHASMEWPALLIREANEHLLSYLGPTLPTLTDFRAAMVKAAAVATAAVEWADRRRKQSGI